MSTMNLASIHKANAARFAAKKAEAASEGPVEGVIERSLSNVDAREIDTAIHYLCNYFERYGRQYSVFDDVAITLLIDILLCENRVSKLQRVLTLFYTSSSRVADFPVERAIEYMFGRLSEMLRDDAASEEEKAVATALAASGAQDTRIQSKVHQLIDNVLNTLLNPRTFGVMHQVPFISTIRASAKFLAEHKLDRPLLKLSMSLQKTTSMLFDIRNPHVSNSSRLDGLRNSDKYLDLRIVIMQTALLLGNWRVARDCLAEVNGFQQMVEDTWRQFDQDRSMVKNLPLHDPLVIMNLTYRRLSCIVDLFFCNENWVFNAITLQQLLAFTPADAKQRIATMALLSTMCVTKSHDEVSSRKSVGRDDEQYALTRIAETLRLPNGVPTRATIFAEAAERAATGEAAPAVKALFQLFATGTLKDLPAAYALLEKIAATSLAPPSSSPEQERIFNDRYIKAIERAIIEEYIENHFRDSSADFSFAAFSKVKVFFPRDNDAYDIAAARKAKIDMKRSVASFNTRELMVRQAINTISDRVAQVLASNVQRPKVIFNALAFAAENTRLAQHVSLQDDCIKKAAERAENLVKAERERERQEREEVQRQERDRHEKLRRANQLRDRKKLEDALSIARRRKVVQAVVAKHPGIIIPPKVAEDASKFSEKLSTIVASYRRTEEERKAAVLREAHYFEKSARDMERPKREESEKGKAEGYRRDQELRIANFKAQQRRDFDAKKAVKDRLNGFMTRALAYEHAAVEKARGEFKVSKRDEQQNLLDEEIARLAAQK